MLSRRAAAISCAQAIANPPLRVFRQTSGRAVDQRVVIAQLNIEHFRRKLATEQDTAKRLTLLRLLAEEEAKLASLKDASGKHKA
jgi:hypothetical protein